MATRRKAPRPLSIRESCPFMSAEEAWLWFWRCQLARDEGARFVADAGDTARPCDPDDVYRVAAGLRQQNVLGARQAMVLARYGRALAPPDARLEEERQAARWWEEGLTLLEEPLRRKGIVG
ncbi:hypothetical protein [Haematospirillum sp. H4485]|uniref:hypothetical protein n=2 Tax=unclassified Haematospirillum TaxID=2622088 RepID=UPI00143A145E|nr:hypothetical protein [Haematospirillum sp. H4485]NKD55206.1 hypothetical protein [Haematospirillum sp. H4890]NKD75091.1 hypothetical protein [Haematospirillum sp. H4485]